MAPELYHYGEFSTKSDIYSYGVVMLEILTGYAISKFNINGSTDLIAHVSGYVMRAVFICHMMSICSHRVMTPLF